MRIPVDQKPAARQQIARFTSYSAPVSGWNAVDSIAAMSPTDALVLDNFYPTPSSVDLRGGSEVYCSGITGNAKTLLVYNAMDGTSKMFTASDSGIFNVSVSNLAIGAAVKSCTNGKFQYRMFGDGTSQWLIMVNGVDKPIYYNGSTWTSVDNLTSPVLSGITSTDLCNVVIHKGRLIFIQKNSLSFWYLPSGVAGGALTEFDLSSIAQRGGYLVAAESWTVDSGSGPDDRLAFITSKGEVILYQGTDPSNANSWALVGVYHIASPLGKNCMMKIASDLIILTISGAIPMTSLMVIGQRTEATLTHKISPVFNNTAISGASVYGWQAIEYPAKSAVIINAPVTEGTTSYQYVINTINKAWCRFTGWNADNFALYNDELYFCNSTKVYKAWIGHSDLGNNIEGLAQTSFNYFGNKGLLKHIKMFRPVMRSNGVINYSLDIDVDFEQSLQYGAEGTAYISGYLWDQSNWDNSLWSNSDKVIREWKMAAEWPGYCASMKIKIGNKNANVQWFSCDYMIEFGNGW